MPAAGVRRRPRGRAPAPRVRDPVPLRQRRRGPRAGARAGGERPGAGARGLRGGHAARPDPRRRRGGGRALPARRDPALRRAGAGPRRRGDPQGHQAGQRPHRPAARPARARRLQRLVVRRRGGAGGERGRLPRGDAALHVARADRADEPQRRLPQRPLRARGDLLPRAHRSAALRGRRRDGAGPRPHRPGAAAAARGGAGGAADARADRPQADGEDRGGPLPEPARPEGGPRALPARARGEWFDLGLYPGERRRLRALPPPGAPLRPRGERAPAPRRLRAGEPGGDRGAADDRPVGGREVGGDPRGAQADRPAAGALHRRQVRSVQPRHPLRVAAPGAPGAGPADPHRDRREPGGVAGGDPGGARRERAGRGRRAPRARAGDRAAAGGGAAAPDRVGEPLPPGLPGAAPGVRPRAPPAGHLPRRPPVERPGDAEADRADHHRPAEQVHPLAGGLPRQRGRLGAPAQPDDAGDGGGGGGDPPAGAAPPLARRHDRAGRGHAGAVPGRSAAVGRGRADQDRGQPLLRPRAPPLVP